VNALGMSEAYRRGLAVASFRCTTGGGGLHQEQKKKPWDGVRLELLGGAYEEQLGVSRTVEASMVTSTESSDALSTVAELGSRQEDTASVWKA
jgi:hypothetical protein